MILKNQLLPMFSMNPKKSSLFDDVAMRINYGEKPFQFQVNALSFNQIIQNVNIKGMDAASLIDPGGANSFRDKMSAEEDKLHTTLEKSYFKVSLLPDPVKSFSQFPPSVYRRSFAATRIQRAWRKYRGKKMRNALKKEQVIYSEYSTKLLVKFNAWLEKPYEKSSKLL